MLDRYWQGATTRISPEAPVPVVSVSQHEDRPGGAGNVALNIASVGGHVLLDGIVGDDEAGDVLAKLLNDKKVECCFAPSSEVSTITKLRVLSRHQQLIRLDFEYSALEAGRQELISRFEENLKQVDVVVLSDYAKGTISDNEGSVTQKMIELARNAGKPVLVDPKGNDFDRYRGATVVTPNMSEFEAVVGYCASDDEIIEKGNDLLRRLGLQALMITRSERGVTLLQAEGDALHIPAHALEVFDVTGAGDTVIAILAATLAAGETLDVATRLANIAAGIVVGKLGAACVLVEELRKEELFRRNLSMTKNGALDETSLMDAVQYARSQGEKIIMTNGCFDLLHAGHVTYLEQASKLGDRLIVAVNDDASVSRLKGKSRPIVTIENRMKVLAALECVDWVVPFSEDTPEQLICKVLPDVLVKGGDYMPEEIAGNHCVRKNGGETVVLGYEQGCSTSAIIDAILNRA